jgi:hypothetical protein
MLRLREGAGLFPSLYRQVALGNGCGARGAPDPLRRGALEVGLALFGQSHGGRRASDKRVMERKTGFIFLGCDDESRFHSGGLPLVVGGDDGSAVDRSETRLARSFVWPGFNAFRFGWANLSI